jgi:hypothetical protein
MRVLVVFESMFGNTHLVAERIARGLAGAGEVRVASVAEATDDALAGCDLVVVGGPTHVHGMASARTRDAAREQAGREDADLAMDPDAEGPMLREWFDGLTLPAGCRAAAFDTRLHGPAALTGRASRGIAKRLERHGASLVAPPESFFVGRDNNRRRGGRPCRGVGGVPRPRGRGRGPRVGQAGSSGPAATARPGYRVTRPSPSTATSSVKPGNRPRSV